MTGKYHLYVLKYISFASGNKYTMLPEFTTYHTLYHNNGKGLYACWIC